MLLALGRFGSRLPLPDQPAELSPDALAVALLTVFRPERAAGIDAAVTLDLSGEEFVANLRGAGLRWVARARRRPGSPPPRAC